MDPSASTRPFSIAAAEIIGPCALSSFFDDPGSYGVF